MFANSNRGSLKCLNKVTSHLNIIKKLNKNSFYRMPKKGMMDFDASKDYYKTLGVSSNSTDKQIKLAYHKLAKKHHPDVNGGKTTDQFKEMSAAYDILSDPNKRKQYDDYRSMFSSGGAGNAGGSNPFWSSKRPESNSTYNSGFRNNTYTGNQNQDSDFHKDYTKSRTTYSFRDPKTGEYKTYTYEGDSQGNPFFKDFEEFMKKFNDGWGRGGASNFNNFNNFNRRDNPFSRHSNNNSRKPNDNFYDPYHQYKRENKNTYDQGGNDNRYTRDPRYQWTPNWTDYDYYNYLYARRIFTYFLIGASFLFFLLLIKRRRYTYIDDPYAPHPYVTYTPYPPIQGQEYQMAYPNQGVVPPKYNTQEMGMHPGFSTRGMGTPNQTDPYLSPSTPKFK